MKKGFMFLCLVGMLTFLFPLSAHAMSGDDRNASEYYDTVRRLINKQSHTSLTNSQIDEYYDHFMNKSNWRPGQIFPYPDNGIGAGKINDGTYTYDVEKSNSCYAYSKFVSGIIYGMNAHACEEKAAKNANGENTEAGIKAYILKRAQFGEHIRINDLHSVTFLATDADGFFGMEYWSSGVRFVHYTYKSFAKQAGYRDVWVYDADPGENIEKIPEISNPRVMNLKADSFDITCDLKNGDVLDDASLICEMEFYYNPDSVSWGKDFPEGKAVVSNKLNHYYFYSDSTCSAHFSIVEDYNPDFGVIGMYYNAGAGNIRGKLPKAGIEKGPYITKVTLSYRYMDSDETKEITLDYSDNPILINLKKSIDKPVEGEESKESDNGGNENPDDTPIGNENANKDNDSHSGGGRHFGEPQKPATTQVQAPREKQVGTTFSSKDSRYKVVGDKEVYLTNATKKSKKVTVGQSVTVDGVTYRVTGVSPRAFKDDKKITEVTIEENVEVIGKGAFQGCKNLKTIKIKARNLRLTYKNSFAGTNAKMQVLIRYKDRLKKYKKLIAKSGVSKNTKYSYKKF